MKGAPIQDTFSLIQYFYKTVLIYVTGNLYNKEFLLGVLKLAFLNDPQPHRVSVSFVLVR